MGELSTGGYHACGLKTDGTVVCWGRNTSGQTASPPGLIAVQVSAGALHSCALKTDGTVVCWGDNSWGELNVPGGLVATQVGAGVYQTCAVRTDATVACWGGDPHGQSTVPAGLTSVAEVIPALRAYLCFENRWDCGLLGPFLRCGEPARAHCCGGNGCWKNARALKGDGTLICWGYSPYAALPAGIVADHISAGGGGHTCALAADATVSCWGFNNEKDRGPDAVILPYLGCPGEFRVSAHLCAPVRRDSGVLGVE